MDGVTMHRPSPAPGRADTQPDRRADRQDTDSAAAPVDVRWDPQQYLRFSDHRGRPFHDLLARVDSKAPRYIVDLGCGPGTLTAGLLDRWPDAYVEGVDSAPEMIADAEHLALDGRLHFELADVRTWRPTRPVDLVLSNAMLQWVPEHVELLSRFVDLLAPGGCLAFQVPGNFDSPSHRLLDDVAADPRWAELFATGNRPRPASAKPDVYLAALVEAGCHDIDVWETTYLYVLQGPDPVFEWVKGTAARPYLQHLPESLRLAFEEAYKERLRVAYPAGSHGTVLDYRRIFAVAYKKEDV